MFFVRSKNVRRQALGYFLIARACLTRQGFVLTIPIFCCCLALGGLAFYCHFAFARRLICAVFACHGCIRRCLVSDVALGGVFAELAVKNILAIPSIVGFIIAVMITYASRIRDGGWRIFAVIVGRRLLLWMIMLIKTSEWAYSQPAFGAAVGVFVARLFFGKIFCLIWRRCWLLAGRLRFLLERLIRLGLVVFLAFSLMVAINGNPQKKLKKNRHDSFSTQAEWAVILTVLLAAIAVLLICG